MVTTCNYGARAFGVRSAMPGSRPASSALTLIFLPVPSRPLPGQLGKNSERSSPHAASRRPLSLDEAFLDVSGLTRYAWDIAKACGRI